MTETGKFWRITYKVVGVIGGVRREIRHHLIGVPGTKKQAARHARKVCAKTWPTAKLRLASAMPDRKAEEREARNAQAHGR